MMILGNVKVKVKINKKGNSNRSFEFSYTNSKGQFVQKPFTSIPEEQISIALLQKVKTTMQTLTVKVLFEEEGDRILKMREEGQPWDRDTLPEASSEASEAPKNVNPKNFHNPYNFVPAPPRKTDDPELGDRKPVGHGCYHSDRWTGRISVKLKTITPLLIPDASEMTENNDHKTYPVRLGTDGKPYLPPTSIKGMLRSAYEAVTNSRLSIFEKHDARLAYRMPANTGLQMVPARIENGQVCLYPGTSAISRDGKPQGAMYAAWLPRYERNSVGTAKFAVKYPDRSLPEHGQKVEAWVEEFAKKGKHQNTIFKYWKVKKIVPYGQNLGNQQTPSTGHGNHQPTGKQMLKIEGYVCVTNKNIDRKHDERVFFVQGRPICLPLTNELKQKWRELISNYQDIHKDERKKGLQSPPALNNSRWSRHIMGGEKECQLSDGTLCYAYVYKEDGAYQIQDLYPVMITRGLYAKSPESLLNQSLKPATKKEELSPADRVFGWVNQKGKGSYKGHLRVHSVTCMSDDPIATFNQGGVPLAILGQPKPEQGRFYCADDREGIPLEKGIDKDCAYESSDEQSIRGRKVYPHHQGLPAGYWDNPQQDRTQQSMMGHYQEYRRPKKDGAEQRDDQNRSMKSWVKVGTEFTFDIDVTNLSDVELGALLYLLTLPDIHYHRLGGGKSLGFGSVRLDLVESETDLRKGKDWSDFYRTLLPDDVEVEAIDVNRCVRVYQDAVKAVYGKGRAFEKVPFIAAFCRCAKGFDDNAAVRYPRVTEAPTPEGEAFNWFVENERSRGNNPGLKLALPALDKPSSLPIAPN